MVDLITVVVMDTQVEEELLGGVLVQVRELKDLKDCFLVVLLPMTMTEFLLVYLLHLKFKGSALAKAEHSQFLVLVLILTCHSQFQLLDSKGKKSVKSLN